MLLPRETARHQAPRLLVTASGNRELPAASSNVRLNRETDGLTPAPPFDVQDASATDGRFQSIDEENTVTKLMQEFDVLKERLRLEQNYERRKAEEYKIHSPREDSRLVTASGNRQPLTSTTKVKEAD